MLTRGGGGGQKLILNIIYYIFQKSFTHKPYLRIFYTEKMNYTFFSQLKKCKLKYRALSSFLMDVTTIKKSCSSFSTSCRKKILHYKVFQSTPKQ